MSPPFVVDISGTMKKLMEERTSISRFGDGEFNLMLMKKPIRFQKYSPLIAQRLLEVINSDVPGLMVGIPDLFGHFAKGNTADSRFWLKTLNEIRPYFCKEVDNTKLFYNSEITRICSVEHHKYFKEFFRGKRLIIVEGELTRFGVGNDLIGDAKEVRRILCPAEDAFEKYDEIFEECKKYDYDEDTIFLIVLGPTATILAYDLHKSGRRAIDIGHLDICYEWARRGKTKIKIPYKYVNEADGGNRVSDCKDNKYLSEIAVKIK